MRRRSALFIFLALAACNRGGDETETMPDRDPAAEAALNDQIMTDPDLSHQNEGNAAITIGGDNALPRIDDSPEAIAKARAEAAALLAQGEETPPLPSPTARKASLGPLATPVQRIAALTGGQGCGPQISYSAIWAAKMPADFPVYPRGATMDAAGSLAKPCPVRSVSFLTPVPAGDVLAFYWARAQQAGFDATYTAQGDDAVVAGRKAGAAFEARAHRQDGLTAVDLTTLGGV